MNPLPINLNPIIVSNGNNTKFNINNVALNQLQSISTNNGNNINIVPIPNIAAVIVPNIINTKYNINNTNHNNIGLPFNLNMNGCQTVPLPAAPLVPVQTQVSELDGHKSTNTGAVNSSVKVIYTDHNRHTNNDASNLMHVSTSRLSGLGIKSDLNKCKVAVLVNPNDGKNGNVNGPQLAISQIEELTVEINVTNVTNPNNWDCKRYVVPINLNCINNNINVCYTSFVAFCLVLFVVCLEKKWTIFY